MRDMWEDLCFAARWTWESWNVITDGWARRFFRVFVVGLFFASLIRLLRYVEGPEVLILLLRSFAQGLLLVIGYCIMKCLLAYWNLRK